MKLFKPLMTLALLGATSAAFAADAAPMSISSSSFQDNAVVPKQLVGTGTQCGSGQGMAPAISWSNLPKGAKSVAVVLYDPDGGKGQGVFHWVAYNIPAARGQLAQGEAAGSIKDVTVGKNSAGDAAYRGLCPPAGDSPHHYVLTVIATDTAPGSLAEGLDHSQLLEALKSHTLAAQTIVGRYGH